MWVSALNDTLLSTEPCTDVSIVVPVFNEERRLVPGLEMLDAALTWGTLSGRTVEVLVVDDGSTDQTREAAAQCLARFPRVRLVELPENQGKGAAIKAGVAAARGAAIVFTDVDMAVDPTQLTELVDALDGADMVMASRAHPASRIEDATRHRQVMGIAFHRIVRAVTELPYRDTQCGFKAFRAPVARMLFHCSSIDRFAFDVELLTAAHWFGLRIVEMPVAWHHVRGSRIRPVLDPLSMVRDVTRIRRHQPEARDVPAARIRGAGVRLDVLRQVLGSTLPLLHQPDGSVLALFPLCSDGDVDRLLGELTLSLPSALVARALVPVAELKRSFERPRFLEAAEADASGGTLAWRGAVT